jgi:hypothetical protein
VGRRELAEAWDDGRYRDEYDEEAAFLLRPDPFPVETAAALLRVVIRDAAAPATTYDDARTARKHASAILSEIIRDVSGDPFNRISDTSDPWTSVVSLLAQSIYFDRAFDRLPVLADALEEAGCNRAEVLDHCRTPGPHVRGCWVVDLILGKQ